MKKIAKISACVMAMTLSATLIAKELDSGQITAKVSTMGIGVEYNYPVSSVLSIGFGINKFSKTQSLTESDINYNGDIDLKSASIIANYHPWKNGFRLRVGVYHNSNKVILNANSSTGDLTIGDTTFTDADITLNGNLRFKKFAPYIGIGYGSEPIGDNNISFDFDIGVMRSPVSATLSGTCTQGKGAPTICNKFNAELAKEQNDLSDSTDDLDLYPVVSLGLSYRF